MPATRIWLKNPLAIFTANGLDARGGLVQQDGVRGLHDLHIWPLSTTHTALAVHLVWQGADPDAFIDRVTDALAEAHGIANVTLQLEGRPCDRAA